MAEAKTFLEWLIEREPSPDDPVACYAGAIADDYRKGKRFNLLNTAIPSKVNDLEISNFTSYCIANNIHPSFANILLLGNAMAVMEYNVGLVTGLIPCEDLTQEKQERLNQIIADCCDILPAILQDMSSDMKTWH